MFNCAYCDGDILVNAQSRKRLKNSKSGLIFCNREHKNLALKLAMAGDVKFLSIVPRRYKLDLNALENGEGEFILLPRKDSILGVRKVYVHDTVCGGCLNTFKWPRPKKYCNNTCMQNAYNRDKLNRWLGGEHTLAQTTDGSILAWARRFLMEEVQYACSQCRWSEISANGTIHWKLIILMETGEILLVTTSESYVLTVIVLLKPGAALIEANKIILDIIIEKIIGNKRAAL
jgi:hypothetical protein